MNILKDVISNELCSGCGACVYVCGKGAIHIGRTNIGRLYAIVDDKKCISCGICHKVCPSTDDASACLLSRISNNDKIVGDIQNVFVGHSANQRIYENAQSGGAVTQILYSLLKAGKIDAALVCRTDACHEGNYTHPVVVTQPDDLFPTQRSYYSPVDLLTSLVAVEQYKRVAIVGCPCQIQGITMLQKYHRSENVQLKIGLICDRCMSSACNQTILKFLLGSRAKLDYRAKLTHKRKNLYNGHNAYRYAPMLVELSGSGVPPTLAQGNALRLFLKDFFTPIRCLACYDKLNTQADIVCGDPWEMSNVDWDNGDSVIITRSKMGNETITQLKQTGDLILQNAPLSEVIVGQKIQERHIQMASVCDTLDNFGLNHPYWLSAFKGQSKNAALSAHMTTISQRFFRLEKMNTDTLTDEVARSAKWHFLKQRLNNKLSKIWNSLLRKHSS